MKQSNRNYQLPYTNDHPRHVVFVFGLSENITQDRLIEYFSQFGRVLKLRLKLVGPEKVCYGYGYLECSTEYMMVQILKFSEHQIPETKIMVIKNIRGRTIKLYKASIINREVAIYRLPPISKE